MIVCVCNRISSRTVEAYAREGLGIDALRADYGLASNCGQCLDHALTMIDAIQQDQRLFSQAIVGDVTKVAVG